MIYVLGMMVVGVLAYVAVESMGESPRLEAPPPRVQLSVRTHRLIIEDFDTNESDYHHFKDVDYIAIRTRGRRRRQDWIFGFGDVRLKFREGTRGLDDVIDYILHAPPKGADLDRFSAAMEATDTRLYVLLDCRHPDDRD